MYITTQMNLKIIILSEIKLQYSCLEHLMDRGPWWAIVRGVTKSQIH